MGDNPIELGFGKIYVCRAEDLEKSPDKPMQVLGNTVGLQPGMLTYKEDGSPVYFQKGFSGTFNATLEGDGSGLVGKMTEEPFLVDVTIQQKAGRLPRKMKKAYGSSYRRATKWKRKLANYIRRKTFTLHDAEIVVTEEQRDRLSVILKSHKRNSGL